MATTMLRNSIRTGLVFKTFTQEESQFFSAIVLGLDHANRQAEGSLFGYSLMAVTNTALTASISDDSITMDADQRRHRMGSLSSELVPGRVILWIEPDDLDEQGNIQFFEKYDTPFPEYPMDGDQILTPGAVHPNGDRFWTATFGYLQIDPEQCKDASPNTCYNAVIHLEFSQEARSLKATFVCLYSLYEETFDPHFLPWNRIPNLYKWVKAGEVERKSKLPGPLDYDTEDSDDETVYKFTGIAVSDISLFGISKVPLEMKHMKLIRFVVTDPRHRLKVGYKYRFNAVMTENKYIWNVTDCARMSGFREILTPGGRIKTHVRKIYYSNGVFRNGTEMGDSGYGIMDDPLNLVREHVAHDHRPDAEAKVGIMDTPFNKNDKTIFRFRIVELFNDGRLQLFSKRAPILHKALFGVMVGKRVIFAPEIDGYLVNIRPEFRHEPAIGSLVVCKPDWDNERRKYYTVNVQLMHATRLQTVYKPVFRESDQLAYAFRVRGRPSPAFSGFFTCHHFGLVENRYDLPYEIKENEDSIYIWCARSYVPPNSNIRLARTRLEIVHIGPDPPSEWNRLDPPSASDSANDHSSIQQPEEPRQDYFDSDLDSPTPEELPIEDRAPSASALQSAQSYLRKVSFFPDVGPDFPAAPRRLFQLRMYPSVHPSELVNVESSPDPSTLMNDS